MIKLIETKRTDPRLLQRMQTHYSKPKGFVGRDFNIEDRLKKLEEQSKVLESRIKATEVLLDKEIISTENKFKSLRQQVESETKKLQMKILLDGDPALTDTRLAKLLGVSRQTIYRWKNDMSQEDWDEMKSNILEYFV